MNEHTTDSNRARIVLALAASAALLVGCVTQGSYDDIVAEKDALRATNQDLLQQLEVKQAEVQVLEAEMLEERAEFDEARQTYDQLLAELSVEVAAGEIAVEQMQYGVNVRISEQVLFASGSARVGDSGRQVLERLAEELSQIPYQIVVGGYSDNVPIGGQLAERFPTNWDLADARASRVVAILESHGVPAEQLVAVSFGETQPVASNDTPEGRAQNRRIEVRIRPVEAGESTTPLL